MSKDINKIIKKVWKEFEHPFLMQGDGGTVHGIRMNEQAFSIAVKNLLKKLAE